MTSTADTASADRLVALDAFRGATVAGMILVNNPGTWSAIYGPLEHAEWHGWTPTDLVFPFFLYIVGVSISLAFARRIEKGGNQTDLVRKVTRRAITIFALGMLMVVFPFYEYLFNFSEKIAKMRIPGVLQRIAVCYFLASLVFIYAKPKTQYVICAVVLVGYWLAMALIPVPGFGHPDLSVQGNIASYLDRVVLGAHKWKPDYDPEGFLSTLPAAVTTMLGVFTGNWLRQNKPPIEKVAGMMIAGAFLVIAGWVWHRFFPINKSLWTSSYVLFTGGLALQGLALSIWLIDIKGFTKWAFPFVVFGMNALAVFVFSGLLAKTFIRIKPLGAGGPNLQGFIYQNVFAPWATPVNASLMYALCYVGVWYGAMYVLYKRRIFIKV